MFINYKIKDNVIYLYVDNNYEIGSFFKKSRKEIKEEIKEYIKKNKIKFNGLKAVLIISGLMMGSIDLKDNNYEVYNGSKYVNNIVSKVDISKINYSKNNIIVDINQENLLNENDNINNDDIIDNKKVKDNLNISKNNNKINSTLNKTTEINNQTNEIKENIVEEVKEEKQSNNIITIKRSNGQINNIELNDYLIGVVASEMPASFEKEALKAQSVVARTYTLKLIEQKRIITDDISTQEYKDIDQLKKIWGNDFGKYYNKIKESVYETNNLTIKYNGNLIDAVYHSTSNGYTEDSVNVWNNSYPYLKSVESPWDKKATSYLKEEYISFLDISNKLGIDFNSSSIIEILSKNESGRINKIKVNDNIYTGVELRNLLNLRSTDFDIEIRDNDVKFTTRGYGHGVGLSQYGANLMAKEGYDFKSIIKHYYTNVTIN